MISNASKEHPRLLAVQSDSRTARWHGQLLLVHDNAWAIGLRGWLAIAFGLLVLIWPTPSLRTAAWLFATYAVLDGALALVAALWRTDFQRLWWGLALEGLTGVLMGVLIAAWSALTPRSLAFLMAVWAVGTGGFEIAMALRLHRERLRTTRSPLWMALCGILSGLFGLTLILTAPTYADFVPLLFGLYATGFGVLLLTLFGELNELDATPVQRAS